MTWPNVMVTNYMRETGQTTPEIDAKARSFVNEGYQLILTFESTTEPGGFNWWGNAEPGNIVLTAAGMQMLNDMDGILDVDRKVIDRAHRWMEGKQDGDGSWDFQSQTHSDIANLTRDRTIATAFVVWSMADTGYTGGSLATGLSYIKGKLPTVEDTYTLAVIANALASAEPAGAPLTGVLERLHEARVQDGQLVSWTTGKATAVGAHGAQADVETTGLVTLAMIRGEAHSADVQGALGWLAGNKDSFGQWGSTQATVLALRAMIASLGFAGEAADATVTVSVDDELIEEIVVNDFNKDVMHLVDLREQTEIGRHEIKLAFEGEGNLFYQVTQVHYLPWDEVGGVEEGPLSVSVEYDRTELEVDGTVTGTVTVTNSDETLADMVMVELGLPPGFDLDRTTLNQAVAEGLISRFETTPRRLIVYLMGVVPGEPLVFRYTLVARTQLRAEIPRARVYSYYNPDVESFQPPVAVTVN